MAEKKEWVGVTINETNFLGRLVDDPQVVDAGGGNLCAFAKLKTVVGEMGPNGQFTDVEVIVPLVIMDHRKVENVIQKHCAKGRELYVKGYYKNWQDANGPQHGFMVTYIKLGSKPFVPRDQQQGGGYPAPPPTG
jgi:single-stranded DNA-binding protein